MSFLARAPHGLALGIAGASNSAIRDHGHAVPQKNPNSQDHLGVVHALRVLTYIRKEGGSIPLRMQN